MKTIRLLILPLLIACSPFLPAAETAAKAGLPAGKPQQLSSPDQVPEGLAKSDWSSIRAAYEAGRHAFQPIEGGWQARNPGQQWTTKFDHRGFLTQPREGTWQWGLELKSYGFGETQITVGGTPAVKAEGQRLSYRWDDSVQEWFVNDQRGLEHGFIIAKRPADAPDSQTSTLNFLLATRGTLRPSVAADAQGVLFQDDSGTTVLNYTGLKVWDADGKILRSRFEAAGKTDVRLLVEEQGARYPLTIDPIAQQAYLKSGNNGGSTLDLFGDSVAVSGDTVVVGAYNEDSSTTGVNSMPNENMAGSGAAYVFVRSGTTWSQQAYLKASNTHTSNYFGYSVAVSGDTVVVGAIGVDISSGAAYVFVRSGTVWSQQAYLKADNSGNYDYFGRSVAISGDTVVVGAYGEASSTTGVNSTPNESASYSGAAYVFTRSGTTWSQQAYLKASNTGAGGDQFGYSVAVSIDTVVVGAWKEDSSTTGVNSTSNESATDSGAAYVFVRSGTTWSQQAYLKASNTGANDQFGYSVAVSGGTVVVGAFTEDSSTTGVNSTSNESAIDSGAAYVFVRSGTVWSQQAYLKASNTGAGDYFGYSVAVSSDTVVVGASAEDSSTTGVNSTPDESASSSGAAYVFVRSGTTWSQQAYLKTGNTGVEDQLGCSVAVSGDTVVVGAVGEDSSTTGVNSTPNESASYSGAAYVFTRSGTAWSQQAYMKASNTPGGPGVNDFFGYSVSVSGDTVVVGAYGEDSSTTGVNSTPDESASSSGAAYVFVRSGTTWSQQAYLKASNTGASDQFGWSVAVSGDTVVVGAILEDSSTTGVNSTPDEIAADSGAAYVFTRSGTVWSQQAYLKAGNAGAGDRFGWSVAVSGDTVVVGAYREDSSTTGVNSTPDEIAADSGAAYVFMRSGTVWSQQAYLKAGNTGAGDQFGYSVAISGDTVVVGANGEDSSTTGVNSTPNESASASGAAYVFMRSSTVWSQQAYLKAGNTGTSDQLGISVAVSGDTVIVGAYQEDSSTTGVNSTPNESAINSGAAYVFVRSGTVWSQQAYLKAGNTGATDYFGYSVAVAGDKLVIGAWQEDSSTTGVNSTPIEGASNSGAAYVFVRSGTVWSQQAYLKADNTGANDYFGYTVAVSGDTVVVGAYWEDSSTTGVNSTPDGGAPDSGAAYIYAGLGPVPTLTGIFPASGSIAGGTSVTLTGTGFSGATAVTIGGIPANSFSMNSSTSITATTPAHALGTVDVEVTTPTGTATGTNLFTYTAPDIALEAPTGNPVSNGSGTLAYFSTATGQTSDRVVTVRNTGVVDLISISAAITGLDAGQFSLITLPPTTLAAGVSAPFTIRFSPTSLDSKTATLSITSNDPDESPFTLNLTGTDKTPTEQWRSDYFSITGNSGDAADLADPDHDNLVNLLERAFNLNPTQPGHPILIADTGTIGLPLIRRTGEPPVFSIQYLRRKASADSSLIYTPQFSSDLTDNAPDGWSDATGPGTVESIDSEWERVTVQEDATAQPKRFGRVKVVAGP